jgi:hypothetical protein
LAKDSIILSQYFNGDLTYEEHYIAALHAFARAYQAAAPIDNVREALEKAASIVNARALELVPSAMSEAIELGKMADAIRALIPDTQAKKGE